jgi:hypothetical protein
MSVAAASYAMTFGVSLAVALNEPTNRFVSPPLSAGKAVAGNCETVIVGTSEHATLATSTLFARTNIFESGINAV